MIVIKNKAEEQIEAITAFLKSFRKSMILGLSGGIDSSVVAKLCSLSVKTKALIMPDSITPKSNVDDAIETAKNFGIEYEIIDIEKILEDLGPFKSDLARANTKARIRMVLLYKKANEESSLVAGAGNKSEILTGYFTKYGDGACDILPIGDLYKTETKYLAKALDIPKKIIDKVPSADLYEGQSDEKELGVDYATLDEMLRGFELQMKKEEISRNLGIPLKEIEKVEKRVNENRHKRRTPIILKLGLRTPGVDWF